MKRKMFISISGGATSAVMSKQITDRLSDKFDFTFVFANTGCEDEATLEFVRDCELHYGWKINWVEAVADPRKGKGVRHKVVNFDTASRNGQPFIDVVKKYGIFNQANPACTNRLKLEPMRSFLKSIGFKFGKKLDHLTAIGFRSDEADRCSRNADNFGFIYPLVRWGVTKRDVSIEMKKWDFKLNIKGDHYGNCVWCWKKNLRKLQTLAKVNPEVFDLPIFLEKNYGDKFPKMKNLSPDGRAYFYRNHLSAKDIVKLGQESDFVEYSDDPYLHAHDFDPSLDVGGSCGDSCDIGGEYYIEQEFPFMNDFRVHDMDMSY